MSDGNERNRQNTEIKLSIDWEKTGLNKASVNLTAPAVEAFQEAQKHDIDQPFTVEGGKGCILILK